MAAVIASGTLGPVTPGTEHDLEAAREPGTVSTYLYKIDCGAVAAGETVFIRIYTVLLASGAERLEYTGTYIGGMDADPMQDSVPVLVSNGTGITIRATVQQKNGTGRSFPWTLYQL